MVLTKIEVDSVDLTSKLLGYEYERTYGDLLGEITIRFPKTVMNTLSIEVGMTLTIWRGFVTSTDLKVFDGYVEKVEPEGGLVIVTGIDKLWDLVRKEVTKTYNTDVSPFGKVSDIFLDLVNTYGGLTADSTTVQDSGTVYIVPNKFVCNHADPFERCKKLAEVLDWQFYYRADTNKVYFEPLGYVSNANTLTVGTDIMTLPKWQYDNTEMANDVTVFGAYQEVSLTYKGQIGVTPGYTTTGVTLAYVPINTQVYADAANPPTTLRIGGVPDTTSNYYYYVDKPNKKILPAIGTTFTANNWFQYTYSFAAPIPINMYDQNSIDTYGRFQKSVTFTDIRSVADAELRGTNYLAKYATPFVYTTLKVKNAASYGLAIGQEIHVIDSITKPNVDAFLVINKLRIRYPADYDEIDVGDVYWRLAEFQSRIMEKLKRIEEEQVDNTDILNNLITVNNTVSSPAHVTPRYVDMLTQTVGGTNLFILGHPTYGVLGTSRLGDTDMGAEVVGFRQQYLNSFAELFVDTDVEDTTPTTATWNTTTHQLTFTAGQIAVSGQIDYNNGIISSATMTVTKLSGTFTYSMSADGAVHWETCFSGVPHTFAYPGTDLRWKIAESGASTGTVTMVQLQDYH